MSFEKYMATHPDPEMPDQFKNFTHEELRESLAYWINLANYRANVIMGQLGTIYNLRKASLEDQVTADKPVGNQPK